MKNTWVITPQPDSQARLRLFCFPYAGGGASIFRTWSGNLPPGVEVCPVQFPGREDRLCESPFSRLTSLIETLIPVLQPYLDLPYAFFGHSMGALISFELARELRRRNRIEPVHLFVSGCRAPHLPDPDPPIHLLSDATFVAELRRMNGTPEAVLQSSELMALFLPLLRADFALHETYVYRPGEPLNCPLSVYGGMQDHKTTPDTLAAWQSQARGLFRLLMFPGNHFFLNTVRQQLLQAIAEDLVPFLTGKASGSREDESGVRVAPF